ncbi:MAG: hypothetical protein D6675_12625 [Gemmatimonadetes bacterium]|nr:MAG: hypothetical protein D6675_12625 [Gemmatimonadota bacterium]
MKETEIIFAHTTKMIFMPVDIYAKFSQKSVPTVRRWIKEKRLYGIKRQVMHHRSAANIKTTKFFIDVRDEEIRHRWQTSPLYSVVECEAGVFQYVLAVSSDKTKLPSLSLA